MATLTTHSSPHQTTQVIQVTKRQIGRGWGGRKRADDSAHGLVMRERQTHAFAQVYGNDNDGLHHHRGIRRDALLTPRQLEAVYAMCGDVRAAVDSITRRVSTQDWRMQPNVETDDPLYPEALEQCEAVTKALKRPNGEDDWRTFVVKVTRDALVHWWGSIEIAYSESMLNRGWFEELGTPYGPTIHPEVSRDGRWSGYLQDQPGQDGYFGAGDDRNGIRRLGLTQIALLRLNPNTRSPYPIPIIETIVREVTTLVRASERTMYTMDRHQVPSGFLVLTGMPSKAEDEVEEGLKNRQGRDDQIRILHTMGSTAPAQWLRVEQTFKEVEYRDVVADTRRVVWRNFGVNLVEMGETEGVNRASSQAQIEIGDSHLTEPLLEAWASLMNRHIVQAIIDGLKRRRGARVLCEFGFADEEDLTPEEEKLRAEAAEVRLRTGQTSLNEERKDAGRPPIENGDEPARLNGGVWVPVGGPREDGDPDNDGDPSEPDDPDDGGGGGGTDDTETDEAPDEQSRLSAMSCGPDCTHGPSLRQADELPSDWQSPGRFDGFRTLDLRALFDEVVGYAEDVTPLWKDARASALALVSGAASAGDLGSSDLQQGLDGVLDRLADDWAAITLDRYRASAELGAEAARGFAGQDDLEPDAEERGAEFHAEAMEQLQALMESVRDRMRSSVQAVADGRSERAVDGDATDAELLDAVGQSWDANEHRVTNWSGRLVALASSVMVLALLGADEVQEPTDDDEPGRVEWWGAWVAVNGTSGDERSCTDCDDEAAQGYRPLASFTRYPGGDVQCGPRCRCTTVIATRAEVEGGAPLP